MKKARWVIQDENGLIALLGKDSNPTFDDKSKEWLITGDRWEILSPRRDLTVKPVCIDLKEFDYEIRDYKLRRINKPASRKVIEAWTKGATIQYKSVLVGKWIDCADNLPAWAPNTKYRVKPKNER